MDTTQLIPQQAEIKPPLPGTLIALMGRKRSGKDTVAEYLMEEYGFIRYAFADPIKEACKIIFGFTDEQCWGDQKEVVDPHWNITPRKVFQIIGTELFQYELPKYAHELADINRAFWAFRFARWYEQQLVTNPDIQVVITDCRFPFEADLIKSLGGTVIKITRPNQPYTDMHASETEMDTVPYDYLIENSGTIEDLRKTAKEVFEQLFV